MRTRTAIIATTCAALAAVGAACTKPPQPAVSAAQPAIETSQTFGNYELHYNAIRTDTLTPEVARSYGIQRSQNRVMLNVTVRRKDGSAGASKAVEANVAVKAYNLNGQLKSMEVRRVTEGEAIYYIGEVSISGAEILVFEISATPSGETTPLEVKWKREFFSD
jgi:hypothetical protein